MNYDSKCGKQLQAEAGFCANCGAAVGTPAPVQKRSDRQQLARSAMTVKSMQLAMRIGAMIGFVLVGFAWVTLTQPLFAKSSPARWLISSLVALFVGAWFGIRVVLALMVR